MEIPEFNPIPALVTSRTAIVRPRYPVIDVHQHLGGEFGGGGTSALFAELLDVLDEAGVEVIVDLDGGWGEAILDAHLKKFKEAAPERFQMFGGVDWSAWLEQGNHFGEWAATDCGPRPAAAHAGLEIWKPLGLRVRDQRDELVTVDDARLDPIWATAAELDWPVLIHVADPVAFFDPLDSRNERWESCTRTPTGSSPARHSRRSWRS